MRKLLKESRTIRMILILACFLLLLWGFILGWLFVPVAVFATADGEVALSAIDGGWQKAMLEQILPSASYQATVLDEQESDHWFFKLLAALTDLDFSRPSRVLAGQLPAWDSVPAAAEPEFFYEEESAQPFWAEAQEKKEPATVADGDVLIGIYSTHTAESYATGTDGSNMAGKQGGVYQVSKALSAALEEKGIGNVVSENIHDYPDWSKSYQNSLATGQQMLKDYPSIQILVDLHRDAGLKKEQVTTEINGKSAARIMFVVGSDARSEHPNWQKNKAFAERLADKMEELHPGLLREVRVQNGRYNQHLMEQGVLVEVGADCNTLEEAIYSGTLLADVFAAVLKEDNS